VDNFFVLISKMICSIVVQNRNNMALDTYTQNRIEELETVIAEAQAELIYLKAYEYLATLEDTAVNNYDSLLADYHKVATVKSFKEGDLTKSYGSSEYFRYVNRIKRGISRYHNDTNTKKDPSWAKEAKKMALIVDTYLNKKED